jgi:radical SAM superfamily enzyme YgiQ (UPF0313 family)
VRVLLVSANRERMPSPVAPLGLMWLAAAVRPRHEVRLVDLCFEGEPLAAVAQATREFRPDVVGLGLRNLATNAYELKGDLVAEYVAVARAIREASTAPLVLGGAGFSLQPERLLTELGAEHGIVGEGEHLFAALVDALARGDTPARLVRADAVAGLVRASRAPSLDALPRPAFDLVDPRYLEPRHGGTGNVQTKRGCAFECRYCDYPDLEGRRVRVREPAAVVEEALVWREAHGASHLFFVDSVFNVPRSHALAVCEALERQGGVLPWVSYVTPAKLDAELVAAMARAGCVGVEVGSDAGTDEALARLAKPFVIADVLRAHELLASANIRDNHSFVVGAFDETPEQVEGTLRFVERLDPDVAVFIVFREDREDRGPGPARDRRAILELLRKEGPRHPGWVVPELELRFGPRVERLLARLGVDGPSWLHLARQRRGLAPLATPRPGG